MSPNGDIGRLVAELPQSEPRVLARAREAMINGRNDLALQILEASVERHPSSNMRLALGHVLARDRRYKDAMKHMVAILRDEPRNSEALLLLTDSLIECGEYERASKMLGRATACNADAGECDRLADKLDNLLGETASNVVPRAMSPHEAETKPDQLAPGMSVDELGGNPSEVDVDPRLEFQPQRKRRTTMQGGRPVPEWNVGDPRGDAPGTAPPVPSPSSTPETLRSGTFSTLSGWSDDDATIESGLHPGPDMGGGGPSTQPQEAETVENPEPGLDEAIQSAFDDFEVQATLAFVPDEEEGEDGGGEYAKPGDRTSAIVFEDDEVRPASPSGAAEGSRTSPVDEPQNLQAQSQPPRQSGSQSPTFGSPSVEVDDQPTRERDSLANGWDSPQSNPDVDPTRDEVPSRKGLKPAAQKPRQQGRQPNAAAESGGESKSEPTPGQAAAGRFEAPAAAYESADHGEKLPQNPFGSPSFQNPSFQNPSSQNPGSQNPGSQNPGSQKPGSQNPGEPAPRRMEPTGLTPSSSVSSESKPKKSGGRRWFLLGIAVILLVVAAAAGVVYGSAYMQSEEIASMVGAADSAVERGTYQDYLEADAQLDQAARHSSFLGKATDDFVQGILPPLPGSEASSLKKRAIARRAYLTALIEYRFETDGARKSQEAIARAEKVAPNDPMTRAAKGYRELAAGKPHTTLELLGGDDNDEPDDLVIQQARVEAHVELQQPAAAARAVKNLRTLEKPTLYQQIIIAKVDILLDDPSALEQVTALRESNEENISIRILQAYAVDSGDEARETAERSLNVVEDKLKGAASPTQLALVATARGHLAAVAGQPAEAEKHYRSGINRFPKAAATYLPLIDLKFHQADYAEVQKLLKKADEEGVVHPLLTFANARLKILESKPEDVRALLADRGWNDARAEFYMGLASLDLGDIEEAAEHFAAGSEIEGEFVAPTAFAQVVRAMQTPEEAEKAAYQVDRLASKHPRDAFVHWASAMIRLRMADQMEERKDFAEALDKAESELAEAIELAPGWPLFHYTLCDVHLRGLAGKDAAKACETGQKMAPRYVPGLIVYAELLLQKGEFEEAAEILADLAERRPNEDRIALLAARTAIELGKLEQAEKTINSMLGKPISNGFEMRLLEGRLAFARRDYPKASGYLASAHELRPQDGEAGFFHALTLARLGKLEDAEEVIKEFLDDRVWGAAAWVAFGEVRRRQERYSDALENLRIALRKLDDAVLPASRTSEAYLQSALTYRDRHKWDHPRVLSRLDTALEQGDPDDADVHFAKGLYYLKRRRPNEEAAANQFQKVVDVAPWRCDAIKPLIALYEKLDDDEKLEAVKELSKKSCEKQE